MKARISFVLYFTLFGVAFPAFAEDYSQIKEKNPVYAVAIPPFSFTHRGAEINLDIQVKERQWLTIAPSWQFGRPYEPSNQYFYEEDAIRNGVGLALRYRYFPITRSVRYRSDGCGPFIMAGLGYRITRYEYDYDNPVFPTDLVLGNHVGIWPVGPYKEWVHQGTFEGCLGYSLRWLDLFFLEVYAGIGTRISPYRYDAHKGLNLGEDYMDTGYTGNELIGGIRIGLFLDRYIRSN